MRANAARFIPTYCKGWIKARPALSIEAAASDLSPNFHPPISRVAVTFEPNGLGEATGRGAEPPA